MSTRTKIRRRSDRQLRSLPMLRNSERGTFKRCRFLWDVSYNRLRKPHTAAPALRYGTLIHASLADYYPKGIKRGPSPVETFERLYEKDLEEAYAFGWRDDDGKWYDAGELGVNMLTNYLDTYGPDDEWEVLVTEHPYATLVHRPECGICAQPIIDGECDAQCPGPKLVPWFVQTGILDGVWRHRRKKHHTVVVDHKTAGSINTRYLVMDDQAGSYWTWGVDWLREKGLLGASLKLDGMMFNFMRKAMKDERPTNEKGQYLNKPTAKELKQFGPDYPGSVSKKQPPPYFLRHYTWRDEFDREEQRRRAQYEFAEMEMVKSGELGVTKTPSAPNCNGCWLLDACELHETGNDWEAFLSQTTMEWEPYSQHEIAMGR